MRLHQVEQPDRVCSVCGKKTLSGLAHIDRGNLMTFLCYGCSESDSSLARFKRLTQKRWASIKAGWANAERT